MDDRDIVSENTYAFFDCSNYIEKNPWVGMNTVDIYPEDKLILSKCYGDVRMSDIYELTEKMMTNPYYSPSFNGVVDFRGVNLLIKSEDVHEFVSVAIKGEAPLGTWCYLCDKPMTTAFMTIFKGLIESRHQVVLFNTIEAASEKMNVDLGKYLAPDR